VPLAMVAGGLGWTRSVGTPVETTALAVLVPVALVASAIQTHTHHRALGAVTFAVVATFLFGIGFSIAQRILRESASGSRSWRLLLGVFRGALGISVAWILWTLAGQSRGDPVQSAIVDGTIGVLAIALCARAPRALLPNVLVRAAPALFGAFLGAGALAAWKNAPSFAILCERAPVTLGITGLFACRSLQ
jgi:hypothetical protein